MKHILTILLLSISVVGYSQTDDDKGYLEKSTIKMWKPNPKYINVPQKKVPMYRCWGTTAKGEQCKRSIYVHMGYCKQHKYQVR